MRETWTFHTAGSLLFGRNAAAQVGEVAGRLGAKRAIVVTDSILARAGVLDRVRKPLVDAGFAVDVFDGGQPEPTLQLAVACTEQARTFGADTVVGLGGGSNMDTAKLTALLLAQGGQPRDYVGEDRIPGPIRPLICVPTTAGTGSEVSAAAVFTDTDAGVKVGMLSNYFRPRAAVVDPLLTVSCPPKVTADSGIDALTHAIEAYTAVDNAEFPLPPGERTLYQGRHPFGDMLAEKAITLVGRYLKRAVQNGQDLEAREGMALAATTAGMAFSNVGVAMVHAMEYPVGAAVHVSHGAGNGLLLPYCMRFNRPTRTAAFASIARLLGEDVTGLDESAAADRAIEAVEQLRDAIGVPRRLRDLGVTEGQLRPFAEKAFAIKRVLRVNPRPCAVEDIEGVYRAAW